MMIKKQWFLVLSMLLLLPSAFAQTNSSLFKWQNATIYHIVIDRFVNGEVTNDTNFNRLSKNNDLGFQGGDFRGIINRIDEGYFKELGVNVISLSPIFEQIHGGLTTKDGISHGFHGQWTKDFTAIDPNFGTKADLKELIQKAHSNGIRVIIDININNVGPTTSADAPWPNDWVRTSPICDYKSYNGHVSCTTQNFLADLKTELDSDVNLPTFLVDKWKKEKRFDQEMTHLNDFFKRTGYPKAPKYYLIKWLSDYVIEFGLDGFRALNATGSEEIVWSQLKSQCNYALYQWKESNKNQSMSDDDFYLIGAVANYSISDGKLYDYGDKKINLFDFGFNALENSNFISNSLSNYQTLFTSYSNLLTTELEYYSIVNAVNSSNSAANPFDIATKLLLSPGISQINYGTESRATSDVKNNANKYATMNWAEVSSSPEAKMLLEHYQKLGQFRERHPAIGGGIHKTIRPAPFIFSRGFDDGQITDRVIVALNVNKGFKDIPVASLFKTGTKLRDAYSGIVVEVRRDRVQFESDFTTVLLEEF